MLLNHAGPLQEALRPRRGPICYCFGPFRPGASSIGCPHPVAPMGAQTRAPKANGSLTQAPLVLRTGGHIGGAYLANTGPRGPGETRRRVGLVFGSLRASPGWGRLCSGGGATCLGGERRRHTTKEGDAKGGRNRKGKQTAGAPERFLALVTICVETIGINYVKYKLLVVLDDFFVHKVGQNSIFHVSS